jgi:predicted transcriptional regulator
MKLHISATIDSDLVERMKSFGQQERRSRSQIIELALEDYLLRNSAETKSIVTSEGRFEGNFSREETYERD